MSGCAPDISNVPSQAASALSTNPDSLSFGAIESGQRACKFLAVTNQSEENITVSKFETSCSCIHLDAVSLHLKPHESREIAIWFDPAEEPNFRGKLKMRLVGRDQNEVEVLQTNVDIEVRDSIVEKVNLRERAKRVQ